MTLTVRLSIALEPTTNATQLRNARPTIGDVNATNKATRGTATRTPRRCPAGRQLLWPWAEDYDGA